MKPRLLAKANALGITWFGQAPPLWPPPYNQDTAEAAIWFLLECCWTYNQANANADPIPDKHYIRFIAAEWHKCRTEDRPLIIEKSSRLMVSWIIRGLELWAMGMRCEKRAVCGLNRAKASRHVWRIWWLYQQLRLHRPEFRLPKAGTRGGNARTREFEKVTLPNGSSVRILTQEAICQARSKYTGISMEDFSQFRHCKDTYAAALQATGTGRLSGGAGPGDLLASP